MVSRPVCLGLNIPCKVALGLGQKLACTPNFQPTVTIGENYLRICWQKKWYVVQNVRLLFISSGIQNENGYKQCL